MGLRLKGCGPFGFLRSRLCGPQGTNSLWARSGPKIGEIRSSHGCTWAWVNLIFHRVGQGSFGFGSLDLVFIYTCTVYRFEKAKKIDDSFSQVSLSLLPLSPAILHASGARNPRVSCRQSIKGKKGREALAPSPL